MTDPADRKFKVTLEVTVYGGGEAKAEFYDSVEQMLNDDEFWDDPTNNGLPFVIGCNPLTVEEVNA